MRKMWIWTALLMMLAGLPCRAEGRGITAMTRVTKWGQLPERFEITGQALPEGVSASDFTITGRAAGWENESLHDFICAVAAVEETSDGWALIPETFPEKYFYVRELTVSCAAHPELGFALSDISQTLTETADDFTDVEDYDSRFLAHVYIPESNEPLPLVLVFHGYGDDHNLLSYRTATAWAEPGSQAVRPCVVVAPVINTIYYGSEIARSRIYEGIVKYIDGLIDAGQVDPRRVYAMGNSFGGMAALEIAEQHPGRFAALLALCPALSYGPNATAQLPVLRDVPVAIALAENDETIPASVGISAAEALEAAGNDRVWLRVYSDEEMNAAGASFGREYVYSFHHVELAVMEDEAYAEWLFSWHSGD